MASCVDNNQLFQTNRFDPFNPKLFTTNAPELSKQEQHKYSFLLEISKEDLLKTYIQELYQKIQLANEKLGLNISNICVDEKNIIITTNNDTNIEELTNFLQNYRFTPQSFLTKFWGNNSPIPGEQIVDFTVNNGTFSIRFTEDGLAKQIPATIEIIRITLQNRFLGLGIEQSHFELVDDKTIKAEIITALPLPQLKTYITKSFTMSIYTAMADDDAQATNDYNLVFPTYWHEGETHKANMATSIQNITIVDASASEYNNQPIVRLKMAKETAREFTQLTTNNVGKQIMLIFGGGVVTAPTIQSPIIGGSLVITGSFSTNEAKNFATLLQYGYLAAEPIIVKETVSPL